MRADGAQLKPLAGLYDNGTLRPVLDREFPFDQTLEGDVLRRARQGEREGRRHAVGGPRPWR